MHKIDTLNAAVAAPAPKTPGTPGWFDEGDPEVPRDATHLDRDWCNAVQGELTAAIEAAGLALDKNDRTQLLAAWSILARDKLHGFRADPQDPASLSVDVGPGTFYDGPTGLLVAQGTQPAAFVAPTTNPRKDIIHIDARTGAFGVTAGTEAASPVDPALAFGQLPVARVNLTTATTEITAAEIDDIRYFGALGAGVKRDFQIIPPTALTGSSVGVTGIRVGARRIDIIFEDASLVGSNAIMIRIGDSVAIETTGYTGHTTEQAGGGGGQANFATSNSFQVNVVAASANFVRGRVVLTHMGGNKWHASGALVEGTNTMVVMAGSKTLSGELTQFEVLATAGDTFDNGNVMTLVE